MPESTDGCLGAYQAELLADEILARKRGVRFQEGDEPLFQGAGLLGRTVRLYDHLGQRQQGLAAGIRLPLGRLREQFVDARRLGGQYLARERQNTQVTTAVFLTVVTPLHVPRTAHRTRKPSIGFRVVDEMLGNGIPPQLSSQHQGDVFLLDHRLVAHRDFDRCRWSFCPERMASRRLRR